MKNNNVKPSFSEVVAAFNKVNKGTYDDAEWDNIFNKIKSIFLDLKLEIFSPGASVIRRCITLYIILNDIEHSEGKGITVKEFYLKELKIPEDEYIVSFSPFLKIIDSPELLLSFDRLFCEVDEELKASFLTD